VADWMIPEINLALCDRCGKCVSACPTGAVQMGRDGPQLSSPEDCVYCVACEDVCPTGAIRCVFEITWESEAEGN